MGVIYGNIRGRHPGIQSASPEQVAEAIELRQEGLSWESISAILGCVHSVTWAVYVRRAELLGFAAWGKPLDAIE